MKEVIIWVIASGLLLIGFLLLLIFGLVKKKKRILLFSGLTFLFFVCSAVITGYRFVSKSYNKLEDTFKERTGEEIYAALFGTPQHDCVRVLNKRDQVIPKIDFAIMLEFQTCREELKRILSLHHFIEEKRSTEGWNREGLFANEGWFKPETLGDTVWVFRFMKDERGNGQTIFAKLDSTKAYCIDIFD